ncbi:hypothetical protein F5887DRAFT_915162 [Amanita rubescens]|nr:hypothetical protein F5887DRAFT_915162 [Amanita rubescens]
MEESVSVCGRARGALIGDGEWDLSVWGAWQQSWNDLGAVTDGILLQCPPLIILQSAFCPLPSAFNPLRSDAWEFVGVRRMRGNMSDYVGPQAHVVYNSYKRESESPSPQISLSLSLCTIVHGTCSAGYNPEHIAVFQRTVSVWALGKFFLPHVTRMKPSESTKLSTLLGGQACLPWFAFAFLGDAESTRSLEKGASGCKVKRRGAAWCQESKGKEGTVEDDKERVEVNEEETPRELDWSLWVSIAGLIYYKPYLQLICYSTISKLSQPGKGRCHVT